MPHRISFLDGRRHSPAIHSDAAVMHPYLLHIYCWCKVLLT